MSDLSRRIANLSPEKRALLEERLLEKSKADDDRSIPRRKTAGPCPLSFAQERLWFLDQLEGDSRAYNEPTALRLRGPLDAPALEKGLNEIIRRHETLRTSFSALDGWPVQVIAGELSLTVAVEDLGDRAEGEREDTARRLAAEEANRPFDLSTAPLLRARLLRLDEEDHVLVLVIHHIISDGWSMRVFFRELSTLYGALLAGKPSPLSELPVQYADFALWQRDWLKGAAFDRQLAYWEQRLTGAPVLELPTDRPRPAAQTFNGGRHRFELGREVTEAFGAMVRGEGVTMFMALLAAYKTLLSRYSGQEDIVVGCPIANRSRVELEQLVGFFANSLALRTDLSGDPTFRELLAREKEVALGAYGHQDLPFERLVEKLRPERHLSHSPLFQVMFTLQNTPDSPRRFEGLSVEPFEFERATAKFDLILFVAETEEGLRGTFEYNCDLFDASTVRRMAGHFARLLEGAAADPDLRLSALPLLTDAERRKIVVEWNDTDAEYPSDRCVHELFELQARTSPDAAAVEFPDASLTYAQLDARAETLADFLRRRGVGPGVPVGLCVERSAAMVAAMLGILKAGGAYLPLDPAYPPERLSFLLEDAGALVLLTQQHLRAGLGALATEAVCLDADWPAIETESDQTPRSAAAPDSPAYIIYTSGSTGTPKGVVIPHRAISRLVCNADYLQIEPSDRVAQASNASFDAATFEIWGALLNGARLVGIAKDVVLSPADFAAEIRQREISVLFLTTALFNYFAREMPAVFSSLRCLLFGGETCDGRWVREALTGGRPKRLLHVYGPTESTTFATWYRVSEVPPGAASVPIGRPISNTRTYILDAHLQPVPIGVPGELHIGGDGLALGYLNSPELTAEKFIPNPFGGPGQRLYRTGDLARYLPDGNIEFLGRVDYQVKIRGFRVEPGEIEAVLGAHPGVSECVVVCRRDTPGEKQLVAYVVAAPGRAPTTRDLRSFLERKLPDYMVPSAFVMLESLPLTPNGKVDRRALPAPDAARGDLGSRFVAPRTPVEDALARIWSEALQMEKVGMRDNFFELGGHSLLAVRLFTQIERVFGRKLPLATLFEAPTIEKLAGAMGERGSLEVFPPIVAIQKDGARPPFFAVATADAFIYADLARSLGPDQPFYGLHPQGLVRPENPDIDIRTLAAQYIEQVRAVQPRGPYRLGGSCAGAVVAFEMAQQLRRAAQEVALLVMFDAPGPFHPFYRFVLMQRGINRFVEHMYSHARILLRLERGKRLEYFLMRLRRLKCKLLRRPLPPVEVRADAPVDRAYWMAFNGAYLRAAARYRPGPYPGRLVMFLASEADAWHYSRSRLKWRRLVGGTDVHVVGGTHANMLYEPQVGAVTELLGAHLEKAARSGNHNASRT